ncbi:MAG: TadG family pilus assembly protein, partial [Gammaproteobacteria bacterium]
MVQRLQIGRIRGNVEAFLQDQRGSIFGIMGIGLVMAFGFAALAVDMSYMYVLKGRLQTTADFAVLAAVTQLPDEDAARTMALEYTAKNMAAANHGTVLANADVVTGNWDADTRTFTPAGDPINAVRAVTRRSQANGNATGMFFARILGFDEVDMQTTAIARAGGSPSYCILALESSEQKAVDTGNGTITANDCDVQVNSNNPQQAIAGNPQGDLIANYICVNGAVSSGPTLSPDPETGCDVVPDPLASLSGPTDLDCDYNNVSLNGGTHTLLPGVYCGGIDTSGGAILNFEAGDYVMK